MFGIVAEKPPDQLTSGPTPSVANPRKFILKTVDEPFFVRITGVGLPPTRSEQDCPFAKAVQSVLVEPESNAVKKYSKLGCDANCRNGLKKVASAGGGVPKGNPLLIRTPSVVSKGPPSKTRV